MTLRRSAQWPDQEPGVDAEVALERAEVLAEGRPVPGTPCSSAASGMPSTLAIMRRM